MYMCAPTTTSCARICCWWKVVERMNLELIFIQGSQHRDEEEEHPVSHSTENELTRARSLAPNTRTHEQLTNPRTFLFLNGRDENMFKLTIFLVFSSCN